MAYKRMNKKPSTSTDYLFLGKPIQGSITEVEQSPQPTIPPPPTPPSNEPINYQKEIILYFYDSMLKNIIKDWGVYVDDTTDSIPSGDEVITSKPYEEAPEPEIEEETESKSDITVMPFSRRTSRFIATNSSLLGKRRSDSKHTLHIDTGSKTDFYKKARKGGRSMGRITFKKARLRASTKRFSKSVEQLQYKEEEPPKDQWILPHEHESAEIHFLNGNRYVGELYDKVMHGHGQFTWSDGTTYIGEFRNGEMTGKGRIEYSDKSSYEGEFYKGYRHGYGNKYTSTRKAFYNGEYYLGLKHGQGRIVFSPNNYYEGQWNMDKMEGKGLRHYANGAKYYGDLVKGIRNGFGTIILENHDFYHGEWFNGKKHGYGEYVWDAFSNNYLCVPVQNKYCGMWDQDFIHGFGLLYFGDKGGARYAGMFYRNLKHGPGIMVCNNGNVIKSDPLFVNDKAVRIIFEPIKKHHPSERSSIIMGSEDIETDSIRSCTDFTCGNLEPTVYPNVPNEKLRSLSFSDIRNFVFPCYGFEKYTLAHLKLCDLFYPMNVNIEYVPLSIDLGTIDNIDLTKLINKVAAKYLYRISNTNNKENMNSIKKRYFKEVKVWPILVSEHFCEDFVFDRYNRFKECDDFFKTEEARIRKALSTHIIYLKDLYDYYALVACTQDRPNYNAWLMRICLWQLFMDCRLHYKNITLNEIDEMMTEYSSVIVADIHNPFDIIHFWEFLTCFVALAWKLYGYGLIQIKTSGLLETAFLKFLEIDIFPNAKKHKGTALFDFKDVIPLTAAYEWFKSLGPNFTVYDFLKSACSLNKRYPAGYIQDPNAKTPKVQNGENIAFVSDKIIYREIKAYHIGDQKFLYPEVYAFRHGLYLKPLKFLFLLSARKVLNILKDICPVIVLEDEYISMNHVLSFFEFYEAVLRCTRQKVVQDELLLAAISRLNMCPKEVSKTKVKKNQKKHGRNKAT